MDVLSSAYVATPLIQETGARRTGPKRCLYNAVLLIVENLKVSLIFMRFFSLHSDLGNVRINLACLAVGQHHVPDEKLFSLRL